MTKLTIVVCTRNRASKLGPMLDAMRAINCDHAWELLIIDNASSDDTLKVLEAAAPDFDNIKIRTVKAIGLGAARSAAWPMSSGEIVLFTDDDCYPEPDIANAVIKVFDDHPEIGFAGGRIMLHDPDDAPVTIDERSVPETIEPYRFTPAGTLHGANMVFRRSTLEKTGGFDPMLGAGTDFPCEDIDAVAAAVWAGEVGRFDPTFVTRHHHGRKAADVPKLIKSYDAGRGAYYTKFLLRKDTRKTYFNGWFKRTYGDRSRTSLRRFGRELLSSLKYLARTDRLLVAIVAAPIAVVAYLALIVAFILNQFARPFLKPNASLSEA